MAVDTDVLMITYNRPEYTAMALARLLETCPDGCRVWLWHNGPDQRTLDVVKPFASHPKVAAFNESRENKMLREPTNWFWSNAKGTFLGKVDDDCLVPDGWVERLTEIHAMEPKAGVLSCWPFPLDEFRAPIAAKKIIALRGGHELLQNASVGGSGYLMKRSAVERNGLLTEGESFSAWCIRLAKKGYLNGWPVPLLPMDHMDHPKSPHSRVRSESEFQQRKSLSARRFGVSTYEDNCERFRRVALEAQTAPPEPWKQQRLWRILTRIARRLGGAGYRAHFDA